MMKKSTAVGVLFGVLVISVAGLFFEAALLGLILSWFNVNLTIWQNLAIVFLGNLIFKPFGGSTK
jgi:hypothetical protein